jgi:hypothetical protein
VNHDWNCFIGFQTQRKQKEDDVARKDHEVDVVHDQGASTTIEMRSIT